MLFPNGFGQKALKTLTQISLQDATQPGLMRNKYINCDIT